MKMCRQWELLKIVIRDAWDDDPVIQDKDGHQNERQIPAQIESTTFLLRYTVILSITLAVTPT